ncbi:hypothetical protein L596_022992 [Steinernema carpocapsae]|uniref:G-protein coupled receptors family 1 profile domain-containing protein n=1 Tax=Steinernema carpocapsae TaxID=34508 RepID=A0A4V5ZZ88_STECR|nr:hypothetical protein L596_022992 [Steinernema carpocapsae]
MADLLLAFDRLLAIMWPLQYIFNIKKKFLVGSLAFQVLLFSFVFLKIVYERIEPLPEDVMLSKHVSPDMSFAITTVNSCLAIVNMPVTAFFMYKLSKFKKSVSSLTYRNGRSTNKANMIVIYQMVLAIIFWIIPTTFNAGVMMLFQVNFSAMIGPYNITLLLAYLMTCSILYRVKLTQRITNMHIHSIQKRQSVSKLAQTWKTSL